MHDYTEDNDEAEWAGEDIDPADIGAGYYAAHGAGWDTTNDD
jgi:hypothetical protein